MDIDFKSITSHILAAKAELDKADEATYTAHAATYFKLYESLVHCLGDAAELRAEIATPQKGIAVAPLPLPAPSGNGSEPQRAICKHCKEFIMPDVPTFSTSANLGWLHVKNEMYRCGSGHFEAEPDEASKIAHAVAQREAN